MLWEKITVEDDTTPVSDDVKWLFISVQNPLVSPL